MPGRLKAELTEAGEYDRIPNLQWMLVRSAKLASWDRHALLARRDIARAVSAYHVTTYLSAQKSCEES